MKRMIPFIAAAIVLGLLAALDPILGLGAGIVLFALVLFSGERFMVGLCALVALAPFLGLRLLFPPFDEGYLARFFPDGIDLRVADAAALLLLASYAAYLVTRRLRGQTIKLRAPGALFFALFFCSALLSVPNAGDQLLAFKYALYPIAFSFLAYVFLPLQITRSRHTLATMLRIFFVVAAVAAAIGALSFVTVPGAGLFRRATLLGFGGVFPFGMNHNLLAELLVAAFPFGFILARASRNPQSAFWLRAAAFGMVAIALLTFARTAWIAIAVQAALFLTLEYRRRPAGAFRPVLPIALLFVPLLVYMVVFSQTPEVTGSLTARLALSRFAYFMFEQHPIVGSGTGTFVEQLGSAREFTATFGDPLDAHGFIQKIGAEQGIIGLLTFGLLIAWILRTLYRAWQRAPVLAVGDKQLLLMLLMSVTGSFVYQLFNTSYYNAKLWLPVGLALAARELIRKK